MLGGGVLQHGRRGPSAALPSAQGHPLGRRHRTDGRGCGVHLQNGHRPGHGQSLCGRLSPDQGIPRAGPLQLRGPLRAFFCPGRVFLDESHPAQAHPGRAEHPYHLLRPQACGRRALPSPAPGAGRTHRAGSFPHLLFGQAAHQRGGLPHHPGYGHHVHGDPRRASGRDGAEPAAVPAPDIGKKMGGILPQIPLSGLGLQFPGLQSGASFLQG